MSLPLQVRTLRARNLTVTRSLAVDGPIDCRDQQIHNLGLGVSERDAVCKSQLDDLFNQDLNTFNSPTFEGLEIKNDLTADQGTFKTLRIGDPPYDMPAAKGNAGDVMVMQLGSAVAWQPGAVPSGVDHLYILNIGSNSHAQIDTHIASTALHWTGLTKTLNENQALVCGTGTAIQSKAPSELELSAGLAVKVQAPVLQMIDYAGKIDFINGGEIKVDPANNMHLTTTSKIGLDTPNLDVGPSLGNATVRITALSGQSDLQLDVDNNHTFRWLNDGVNSLYHQFWDRSAPAVNIEVTNRVTQETTHSWKQVFLSQTRQEAAAIFGPVANQWTIPGTRATVANSVITDVAANGTTTWQPFSTLLAAAQPNYYGEAYMQGNATPTTFLVPNTYATVAGTFLSAINNGWSLVGNTLVNGTGVSRKYKIDVSGSWQSANVQDYVYQLGVYVDAVPVSSSFIRTRVDNSALYPTCFACACLANISNNQVVSVKVRNTDSVSTQGILVIDLSVTIFNITN